MMHEDPSMSAILGRMQGPLHVSKLLRLRLTSDLKGWSGKYKRPRPLSTQHSASTINSELGVMCPERV